MYLHYIHEGLAVVIPNANLKQLFEMAFIMQVLVMQYAYWEISFNI